MGNEKINLDVTSFTTPEGQILVTCIPNVLDPFGETINKRFDQGITLKDCLAEFFPSGWNEEYELVVAENGSILDEISLEMQLNGKYYTFAIVPQGGNGGSNVVGKALMVVAAIAIAVATYGYGSGYSALMISSLGGGFSGTISLGTLAALGVAAMAAGYAMLSYDQTLGNYSTPSPTYSWNSKNEIKEGSVWPVLYGTLRITPPLLGRYIDVQDDKQYLNLLFGIGDHAIDSITGLESNENPIFEEDGNNWWDATGYLGSLTQKAPGNFCATRTIKGVGIKFSTSWTTVTFPGNAIEGFSFAISLPMGLYLMGNSGEFFLAEVDIDIEYRQIGTETWYPFMDSNPRDQVVPAPRWSGGAYCMEEMAWVEIEEGTTDPDDHVEGERYYPATGTTIPFHMFDHYEELTWKWLPDATTIMAKGTPTAWIEILGQQNSAIRKICTQNNLATVGAYELRFRFHDGVAPPLDIKYVNTIYMEYLESIIYDDFAYPGSALLPMRLLATDKMSNELPPITMIATRSTVPVWTGATYEDKPANNPAWACYDMLRNPDYGGGIPYAKLIYADFLAWADFCTLNSYTVNIYFDTLYNLRPALDTVSTLGRGHVVQRGSKYGVVIDSCITAPVQGFLFNQANMIKDSFQEEWIPYTEKCNVIEVKYRDANLNYADTPITLYADDYETTLREIKILSINLIGCTSHTMAMYHARYLLNLNRYITAKFSWVSDIDAIGCIPGQVVEIAHDRPQIGYSGRIVSGDTNSVILDREVTMEPAKTYSLVIRHLIDDSREYEELAAVAETTTTNHVHLASGTWTTTPVVLDMYSFGETTGGVNRTTKLARIVSISKSQELRRQIKAIEYIPEVYSDTATIGVIENPSDLAGVIGLRATEVFFPDATGSGTTKVVLTWTGIGFEWYVYYKIHTATVWKMLAITKGTQYIVLEPLVIGERYNFSVTTSRVDSPDSYFVSLTYIGKPIIPNSPDDLVLSIVSNKIVLDWTASDRGLNCTYDIYLSYEAGEDVLVAEKVSALTYIYTGTLTAGTYTFTVYTRDPFGQLSEVVGDDVDQATIEIETPNAPAVFSGTNGETVSLWWNGIGCKTSLEIDHYTVNGIVTYDPSYGEAVTFSPSKLFNVIAIDVAGNVSTTAAHTVTIGTPGAVTAITTIGRPFAVQVNLIYTTFALFQAVEIWASETDDWDTATKVGETTGTSFKHTGLSLGSTWYYWTHIRTIEKEYGAWFPLSDASGVSGGPSTDPGAYLPGFEIDESWLSATLRARLNWIDNGTFIFGGDYIDPSVATGMNGVFETLASLATEHDGRIASTEVEIGNGVDGSWAWVALKASVDSVNAIDGRLTSAEALLAAGAGDNWAWVEFMATTEYVDDGVVEAKSYADSQILAAQPGIYAEIDSRVTVATLDGNDFSRLTALENRFICQDTTDVVEWNNATEYNPGEVRWIGDPKTYWRCIKVNTNVSPVEGEYWTAIAAGRLAAWTLKVQMDGVVAGVGLALDDPEGTPRSLFIVSVDSFQIKDPSADDERKFVLAAGVYKVDGIEHTGVGIAGDMFIKGTIMADCLVSGKIQSQDIELYAPPNEGNVCIRAGKNGFGSDTAGFILGIDDDDGDQAKFEIGDDTYNLKYAPDTGLVITGDIIASGNIIAGEVKTSNIDTNAITKVWSIPSVHNQTYSATGNLDFGVIGGTVLVFISANLNGNEASRTFTLKKDGTTIVTFTFWSAWFAYTYVDTDESTGNHYYTVEFTGSVWDIYVQVMQTLR